MFEDFPHEFGPAMRYELWRYDAQDWLAITYHWLNLCEAIAWLAIALYVTIRMLRKQRAIALEATYALLFFLFGLSDVLEAYRVPLWLIAAKGLIFAVILIVRWRLIKRHYRGYRF